MLLKLFNLPLDMIQNIWQTQNSHLANRNFTLHKKLVLVKKITKRKEKGENKEKLLLGAIIVIQEQKLCRQKCNLISVDCWHVERFSQVEFILS